MDNDVVSQFIIAEQYADGFGVEQDLAVAVSWYRKAAENGYALAQLALARCLSKGLGVAPDQGEALEWFRKAAAGGDSSALCHLGNCFEIGYALPKDVDMALALYRQSAAQDFPLAMVRRRRRRFGRGGWACGMPGSACVSGNAARGPVGDSDD